METYVIQIEHPKIGIKTITIDKKWREILLEDLGRCCSDEICNIIVEDTDKDIYAIGKEILNSTVNTLVFIFFGEYMLLMVNYLMFYSFSTMINSKDFAQGVTTISVCVIGCVLIIPIISAISAYAYTAFSKEKRI